MLQAMVAGLAWEALLWATLELAEAPGWVEECLGLAVDRSRQGRALAHWTSSLIDCQQPAVSSLRAVAPPIDPPSVAEVVGLVPEVVLVEGVGAPGCSSAMAVASGDLVAAEHPFLPLYCWSLVLVQGPRA